MATLRDTMRYVADVYVLGHAWHVYACMSKCVCTCFILDIYITECWEQLVCTATIIRALH